VSGNSQTPRQQPIPTFRSGGCGIAFQRWIRNFGAGRETRTPVGFPTAYKTVAIATMRCQHFYTIFFSSFFFLPKILSQFSSNFFRSLIGLCLLPLLIFITFEINWLAK
jgi:hypothetical protein